MFLLYTLGMLDGFPSAARPCRISGKDIYRALGIENVRHRRTASAPVLMRRLLALDYILEHPQQKWLTSEQKKVAVFDDLDIPRQVLPRCYCSGKGPVRIRNFPQGLPISISPGTATFVYADPDFDTGRNLVSWGSDHAPLWRALQQKGIRTRIVAVARDDAGLARDHKLLRRWAQGQWPQACRPLTSAEEQEIEEIRLAFFRSDWTKLERWGGPLSALFYQPELKRRLAFTDSEPGFRIDRADAWRSQRLSISGETLH